MIRTVRCYRLAAREQRRTRVELALSEGADALSAPEKSVLLSDPLALSQLHFRVWTNPRAHAQWLGLRAASPQRVRQVPHTLALSPKIGERELCTGLLCAAETSPYARVTVNVS